MNEHEERMFLDILNERSGCGRTLLYGCILALVVFCLCGCKTQYVPVEVVKTEYIVKHDSVTLRDSIWAHDSIYVEKNGDTLLVEKWRTKYEIRYRDVVRVDSFIKSDSIQVPIPVERKLSSFEQFCIDYGKITLGVSIAAFIALAITIILWLKRKGLV